MIDHELFKKLEARIDSYENAMISMQKSLTAIPALSPDNSGEGEFKRAEYLLKKLNETGFQNIIEINAPDSRVDSGIRPNILTVIPGKNSCKTAWILTHMDIVPPGELSFWNSNPYTAYVKERKIFGRGTEDNQQDLVSSFYAAKAFLDEGIVPEVSIGLAFVSDEETGSRFGLDFILRSENNPFRKTDLIIVPDAGSEDGTSIEIAEKSILWLKFKTTGKQCHGSKPHLGKNAFLAASHLIVKLHELYKVFDKSNKLFEPPMSTFEPTRKDSNVPNVNTIPGDDIFFMDCRILPDYALNEVTSEIRKMADYVEQHFGVSIEISVIQENQAAPQTAEDAPVVECLRKAIAEIYQVQAVPIGIGGGTVAAHLRKKGYPVAVWSKFDQQAHQPNEYCNIDTMLGNAKIFCHIFLQK
jgi:succinyl-diaminopimelate desuccinylase